MLEVNLIGPYHQSNKSMYIVEWLITPIAMTRYAVTDDNWFSDVCLLQILSEKHALYQWNSKRIFLAFLGLWMKEEHFLMFCKIAIKRETCAYFKSTLRWLLSMKKLMIKKPTLIPYYNKHKIWQKKCAQILMLQRIQWNGCQYIFYFFSLNIALIGAQKSYWE